QDDYRIVAQEKIHLAPWYCSLIIASLLSAVPPEQMVVDPAHGSIDGQSQKPDGDHAGNNFVRPEKFPRLQNAVPESVIHRHHFSNDDNYERDTDPHPKARKNMGGGCREDDPYK